MRMTNVNKRMTKMHPYCTIYAISNAEQTLFRWQLSPLFGGPRVVIVEGVQVVVLVVPSKGSELHAQVHPVRWKGLQWE